MKKTAFINGKLVSILRSTIENTNLLVINDKIAGVGYLPDEDQDAVLFDASNCIIVPGIIDSFVNLNEPGDYTVETIKSGSFAAANAGITSLITVPNTDPCIDSPELVNFVQHKAKTESEITICTLGAMTKNTEGSELAEIGLMKGAGAVGFTDCSYLQNIKLMENCLKYSKILDTTLVVSPIEHKGIINEGYYSTILGLPGAAPILEEIKVERDIKLLEQFGGKIHFFPITTTGSLECIRKAKKRGLSVTCGTAPHYLYLTEADIDGYNTNAKVNPPLRTKEDIQALIEGLKEGTIDMLGSHHIPCLLDDKRTDFETAKFGISGLDLFLPLIINKLYHEEEIDLLKIFKLITFNPRNVFKIPITPFGLAGNATFTVIDLNAEKKISESDIFSNGKNTPFIGQNLKGFAAATVVNGKIITNSLPLGVKEFANN